MKGDYTLYISIAYALSSVVLLALIAFSLRDWRKIRAEVEKLDA